MDNSENPSGTVIFDGFTATKMGRGSLDVLLPALYDIHGRRLQPGDRMLVSTGDRGRDYGATTIAVLETRTTYVLRYENPTSSGVSSSNLAFCDELSDLQRRNAVKITEEPINAQAHAD